MELLEQHFDTAFSAQNGIQKLRELILTLALQGRLVPQEPRDAPASQLLKEIEAEKKRLAKLGKIKAPKPLLEITAEDIPRHLPDGWVWVRNGFLFALRKGKVPKDLTETLGSIPYLDIEALDRGNIRRYTEDANTPQSTDSDILVVCDGSRSGLVLDGQNGAIGSTLSVIETPLFIQPFVKLIFRQGYERMNSTMKGAAIPHLDSKNLLLEVIGLPPLAEQKRILEKIEQLMARCDTLENLQSEREQKRLSTHTAALSQLINSSANGSSGDAWAFITKYFGELYAVKENVDELRKAILQLAVMGKLVPQDIGDAPAIQLLNKIEAERRELIKEGVIKAKKKEILQKPVVLFNVPSNWVWCCIQDVSLKVTDGEHLTPRRSTSGYYLLSARNITNEGIKLEDVDFVEEDEYLRIRKRCNPEIGDVLISCSGSVGRIAIADSNEYVMVRSAALIKQSREHLNATYLANALRAPFAQLQIVQKSKTTAQSNLFLGKILEISIPLPPLSEQNRIVAKVNQLMMLCDKIEQHIAAISDKKIKLLNAVMAQV
jgi:type I restriction enzyme, S subunit